jgi:phage tail-like protein
MPGPTNRSPEPGSTNPDPVPELRFLVELDLPGGTIGHFRECTGIGMEIVTKDYREGGQNAYVHRLPTHFKHTNVVLKRGVTHEAALLQWFWEARTQAKPLEVTVSVVAPTGRPVRTFVLTGAWPVKWTGPSLNATSTNVATETLEIAHNGIKAP